MSGRLTLADFVKSQAPDGSQMQILELLNESNTIIQDGHARASNMPVGDRVTIRSSLPTVGIAQIDKGTLRSKAVTSQMTDDMAMFDGRCDTDVRIATTLGTAAFEARRRQDLNAYAEAFGQSLTQYLLYGSLIVNPNTFDGLTTRMGSLNPGTSLIAPQVWSMGTVVGADGCSILVVDWGEDAISLLYPKHSIAGLDVQDKGEQQVNDDDGLPLFAYVTTLLWSLGIGVRDPRHMARVANIDLSDALLLAPTQGNLYRVLTQVLDLMPEPGANQRVMYCPTRLYSAFRLQAMEKTNLALTMEQYMGKWEPHFMGYPVRKVQRMSIAEATVT